YTQDKCLEGEIFELIKDKFNEVEHVEVDFVKGKATEFVQSEHIEDETQKSDDIEIDQ
ncbi:14375_t:CDS:1, partial [Dentiscutata heterogama]